MRESTSCKDNPDAEPFYEGMDEPLREIHDIWIMQYLRVDGAYFPRIAFEANEDENIEFDSNQEYEILSRKTDGYTYFIPGNFNIYTVGDAQFFYRKNGSANTETCWNWALKRRRGFV